MTSITVTQLKANPAKAIDLAADVPVMVQKRNKTKAYLVGSELFEQMMSYMEDMEDRKAVEATDFGEGKDLEELAEELGL